MAINNVKAVLVDLSGTIHIEDTEIPDSIKALQRYRIKGVQHNRVFLCGQFFICVKLIFLLCVRLPGWTGMGQITGMDYRIGP